LKSKDTEVINQSESSYHKPEKLLKDEENSVRKRKKKLDMPPMLETLDEISNNLDWLKKGLLKKRNLDQKDLRFQKNTKCLKFGDGSFAVVTQ
jgi:hypothetical protein